MFSLFEILEHGASDAGVGISKQELDTNIFFVSHRKAMMNS